MWDLLIALAGIIGLLLLFATAIGMVATLVLLAMAFVPIAGRSPRPSRTPLTDSLSARVGARGPDVPDGAAPEPDRAGKRRDENGGENGSEGRRPPRA